jgi:hypothetical protein
VVNEQRIRAILFYMSVAVFCAGLPFILTVTLGYKFDPVSWKFTRTGLISLRTQPPGASVFLNGAPVNEKTPCSINELLPGRYTVELKLPGYYAYSSPVEVRQSAVARLEKILLFPLIPDVQKLSGEQVSRFWIGEDKAAYYVNEETKAMYRSDLDGEHFEKAGDFVPLSPAAKEWKLSPDRKRVMYFNERQIGIAELEADPHKPPSFVIDLALPAPVSNVFWHADSFNVLVVAGSQICMLETRPGGMPFTLMQLNSVPKTVFFDNEKETVYFQDSQTGADNQPYDNVYRLELRRKLYPFGDFMRPKKNE